MIGRSRAVVAALALTVLAALTACVPAPQTSTDWSVEIYYQDLEPGACLAASFDADALPTEGFDPNAYYFEVVHCDRLHLAQVVGVVDIPAAPEWSEYGTTDGPAIAESDEWVAGVCRAYELFVAAHLADVDPDEELDVSINYATIGDPRLGACIAHEPGFTPMETVVDVSAMMATANGAVLGAEVPAFAEGWFDAVGGGGPVSWEQLDEGACVSEFLSADEDTYPVTSCAEPHAAQFLRWVAMPAEWEGVYAGDDEAAAAVAAQCATWEAAIAERPDLVTGVVVEPSSVGTDFVVDEVLLAQCWARAADGTPLAVDLAPLL
jgi:hypothetical protein